MDETKIQELVTKSIINLRPIPDNSVRSFRDVLEFGAFSAIEAQRIDLFERYFAQLKVYYFDSKDVHNLPESTNKYQLLGLNLLRLLSQNRLAEFHTVSTGLRAEATP